MGDLNLVYFHAQIHSRKEDLMSHQSPKNSNLQLLLEQTTINKRRAIDLLKQEGDQEAMIATITANKKMKCLYHSLLKVKLKVIADISQLAAFLKCLKSIPWQLSLTHKSN